MKKINSVSGQIQRPINSWYIYPEYTTTFGPDDFESWALSGMSRDDEFTETLEDQLYDNCLYLAEQDHREMLQSEEDLREAISDWAREWNKRRNER